jgi:preprotein translocase subunit SecG
MGAFSLLAVGFVMKVVAVLFCLSAITLVLAVLIQKGRGGGLSGAFGGGMASGILGSKTGDFLTWVTVALVGLFLMLAVVMAKFYKSGPGDYGGEPGVRQEQPEPTRQPLPSTPGREPNIPGGTGLPGMR